MSSSSLRVRKGHQGLAQSTILREWACETLSLLAASPPETLPAEVQALAVGEVVFVGLPGEIGTFVSLEIQERSPFAHTWTLGFANDNIGYIVEPREYPAETYGAVMTPKLYGFFPFRPEAGRILTDTACDLVAGLR